MNEMNDVRNLHGVVLHVLLLIAIELLLTLLSDQDQRKVFGFYFYATPYVAIYQ